MDPSEVEFLAEREMVKIVPNFTQDQIFLISVSKHLLVHIPLSKFLVWYGDRVRRAHFFAANFNFKSRQIPL